MRPRFDYPLTAAVAVAGVAATVAGSSWLLGDGAAIRGGELWRLLTGPLVHSSAGQLARDAAGLLILGAAYEAELGRRYAWLLLAAVVLPAAAIAWLAPGITVYYGLSGVSYALLAFAVAHEWRNSAGRPPRWVVVLALVTGAKLAYETVTGRLLFPLELGEGIVPATLAHFAGAAVGIAAVLSWPADRLRRCCTSAP